MLRHTALSLKTFPGFHRLLSLFIFLICTGQIFGQTHSFSGIIGKYPIYLQMTIDGNQVSGYYFYKNKLIDLSLAGSFKSGLVTLSSSDQYTIEITDPELFKFKWPGKTIEGTWFKKGKSLPLKLNPLTAKETGSPKCSNPYLVNTDPLKNNLTRVKIGLFRLKEVDSVRTINRINIRHFEEVLTGIKLFRVDSGMDADKQKNTNSYLEYLQISEFLEALSCAAYSTYGSDYGFGVSDLNLSNDMMCFSVFQTAYCGGAHPNEANYGINFNLNTRQRISSSDFLIKENEDVFDDKVYTYLATMNPEDFNENQSSSSIFTDCGYYKKELWEISYCDFVLTEEGIKMLPSFAHFNAFCLDPSWAVIPYSELKEFIKPEYYSKLTGLKN